MGQALRGSVQMTSDLRLELRDQPGGTKARPANSKSLRSYFAGTKNDFVLQCVFIAETFRANAQ